MSVGTSCSSAITIIAITTPFALFFFGLSLMGRALLFAVFAELLFSIVG